MFPHNAAASRAEYIANKQYVHLRRLPHPQLLRRLRVSFLLASTQRNSTLYEAEESRAEDCREIHQWPQIEACVLP